jgi:hypothetical protein
MAIRSGQLESTTFVVAMLVRLDGCDGNPKNAQGP